MIVFPYTHELERKIYESIAQAVEGRGGLLLGNYRVAPARVGALWWTPQGVSAFVFVESEGAICATEEGRWVSEGRWVHAIGSSFSPYYEAVRAHQQLGIWRKSCGLEATYPVCVVLLISGTEKVDMQQWKRCPDWCSVVKLSDLPNYVQDISTRPARVAPKEIDTLPQRLHLDRVSRSLTTKTYAPYEVADYFEMLEQLLRMPLEEAYKGLQDVLRQSVDQPLRGKSLQFGGLFAKIDYLSKEREVSHELFRAINHSRDRLRHYKRLSHEQLHRYWPYDFGAVCAFVAKIHGASEVPPQLRSHFPSGEGLSEEKREERGSTQYVALRLIVQKIDDVYAYCTDEAGEDRMVKYAPEWLSVRSLLSEGSRINVVARREKAEQHQISPELVIFEPDYLVDISAIAACFESYAHSASVYLLNKIKPMHVTSHILLGNLAGQLLDETIHDKRRSYGESIKRFFQSNALALATCEGLPKDFHQEVKRQAAYIKDALSSLEENVKELSYKDLTVEPSFFSEMLGIQGRMDALDMKRKVVIEQKSGKGGFPPNADPNVPKYQEKHYVQLLLYMALLHYNYDVSYDEMYAFLLYSKYAKGLLSLGRAPQLLKEAIEVRNEIVWCEYSYARGGICVLEQLTAERLNRLGANGTLWQRYQRPQIEAVLAPIGRASALERAYYLRLMTFVEAENLAAKVGHNMKENAGFASKWYDTLEEKHRVGSIFDDLRLTTEQNEEGEVKVLTLWMEGEQNVEVSDFRKGDIVMVYPYASKEEPDVRQTVVFRGSVASLENDCVRVELAYPQTNAEIFERLGGGRWAVEHDLYDSSFKQLYRSLHAFLSASQARRDLVLLQREPRCTAGREVVGEYGDFDNLVRRVKAADDLFLLIGPPGTGKTSFGMLNMVKEALYDPDANVLITSYTNRAVDEICSKLVEEEIDFLRIGSELSCDEDYHEHLLSKRLEGCVNVEEVKQLIEGSRVICGTTAALTSSIDLFGIKGFDLAIVDEASQILEPHLLGLLGAQYKGEEAIKKFVLIGDHKQLPAVVQQSVEESAVTEPELLEIGLTNCRNSLFERLLGRYKEDERLTFMLEKQGRMHEDICRYASGAFYEGRLKVVPLEHQKRELPRGEKTTDVYKQMLCAQRMFFVDCEAPKDEMSDKSNEAEAQVIADVAWAGYELMGNGFDAGKSIGVIVPYRNQIAAVRKALREKGQEDLAEISIDTVERYQGSQRDMIIYGFTVRHAHQLSFLAGNVLEEEGKAIDRKLNVALTRARLHMVMVGNRRLLEENDVFAELMDYCEKRGGFLAVKKN